MNWCNSCPPPHPSSPPTLPPPQRLLLVTASSLPDPFLDSLPSSLAEIIRAEFAIKGLQEPGADSLGLSLCQARSEEEATALAAYIGRLNLGTETRLVSAASQGKLAALVSVLPSLFPGDGRPDSHTTAMAQLAAPLTANGACWTDGSRTLGRSLRKGLESASRSGKDWCGGLGQG